MNVCALGLLAMPAIRTADAQASSGTDRVGMRVIQKFPEFSLRIGKQFINPLRVEIYRVAEDHGHELLITADDRGLKGLVEADKVVAVEQSLDFCTRYISKIPDDPWGYYLRGIIWHRVKKDVDKAIRDFNDAIGHTSESPRFRKKRAVMFCGRGAIWLEQKDFDRAIADFSMAVELDPSQPIALQDRGIAYTLKREYDKAIVDLDQAVMINPADPVAFYRRGCAWHEQKGYDKAIDDFSQAIALRPYFAVAFLRRGVTWTAKKAYDEAFADFNTAIRLEPDSPRGYNGRAWLLATCADPQRRSGKSAVELATKACELSGWKASPFLDTLAAACAEASEFESAIKWESKAIELSREEAKNEGYRQRLALYQDKTPYHQPEP